MLFSDNETVLYTRTSFHLMGTADAWCVREASRIGQLMENKRGVRQQCWKTVARIIHCTLLSQSTHHL